MQIIGFCLYANTFGNGWNYDDFPLIVDNPDIRSIHGFLQNTYPGRPLRELSYFLDFSLFGLNPAGYHLQNILWHALNAFLIWRLALELGAMQSGAWVAALLFLGHPLNVEVVANIAHRKDSLALAFCLMSFLCFIRCHRQESRSWPWLAWSAVFFGIALAAKQNAAILPAMFLAYEFLYSPPEKRLLLDFRKMGLLSVLFACSLGGYIYFSFLANKDVYGSMRLVLATKANYNGAFDLSVYYATVLASWLFSWLKLVLPLNLAPEYSLKAALNWANTDVVFAVGILAAIFAGIFTARKKYPLVSFCLFWFLGFWLPVANLWPQVYLSADRYMYAPAVGIFILTGFLAARIFKGKLLLGIVLACCAILTISVLTWRQNAVWRTPESLWTQAVKVSPDSSFALNNLGNVYFLKGDFLPARLFYEKSTRLDPSNPTAWYNLGTIYENTGSMRQAVDCYKIFLMINAPEFKAQATELKNRFPGIL